MPVARAGWAGAAAKCHSARRREKPAPPSPPPTATGGYPTAQRTANPDQVLSPYEPYNVIDVAGFKSGQLARDPSNQKIFEDSLGPSSSKPQNSLEPTGGLAGSGLSRSRCRRRIYLEILRRPRPAHVVFELSLQPVADVGRAFFFIRWTWASGLNFGVSRAISS